MCSDPDGDVGSSPTCSRATRSSPDRCCASRTPRSTTAAPRSPRCTARRWCIGMRALKVVALGFTLSSEMPQKGVAAGLDLQVYWHRSVLNAVIARALARTVDQPVAEEAFLCGLLSDIGKLALTHAAPEEYGAVVAEAGGWPSDELERERLGFVAGEAAERLLRGWGVPEMLVLGASRTRPARSSSPPTLRRGPPDRPHRRARPARHRRHVRRRPGRRARPLHRRGRAPLRAQAGRGRDAARVARGGDRRGGADAVARAARPASRTTASSSRRGR